MMKILLTVAKWAFATKNRWLSLLLILGMIFGVSFYSIYSGKSDDQQIDDFIKETSIDDAVGQLFMVGIPSDHLNYKSSKDLDKVLKDISVGFLISNTYNYFSNPQDDVEKYLNSVLEFNKNIQTESLNNKIRVPAVIATDFEGPSYSSLKKGFLLPPSALATSVSRDAAMIAALGRLSGNQLHNAGIDIILGPVLDTYNVKQGNRGTLQDRCFASATDGVVSIASHYIKGLRESGVSIFAKHFPSHGSVESNPHDDRVIPSYDGSPDSLAEELQILSRLKNNIDGVMSSHIRLPIYNAPELATFSPEFIQGQLKRSGFDSQIFITDDMSSMGAIKKYLRDSKRDNFSTLAIKAFDAGHDVLLFAHFASSDPKSSFTLGDLAAAKRSLADHIKGSPKSIKRFQASLKKILKLKIRIAKQNGKSISDVLGAKQKKIISSIVDNASELKEHSENFLKDLGRPEIDSGEKLISEIIKAATVYINKSPANWDIHLEKRDSKILFCIQEDFIDSFRTAFGPLFTKSIFIPIPQAKGDSRFLQARQRIISLFDDADIIVYTVFDKSDSDLVSYLESHKKQFLNKAVVFAHCNPIIFDNNVLRSATIISSFTHHPASYPVDIEVLLGTVDPKPKQNLPISIGENGKFYNVEKTVWVESAVNVLDSSLSIRRSASYRAECKTNLQEEYILLPRRLYLLIVIVCLVCLWLFISKFLSEWHLERKPVNPNDASVGEWLFNKFAKYHRLTATIILLLAIVILLLIFDKDVLDWIISRYEHIRASWNKHSK